MLDTDNLALWHAHNRLMTNYWADVDHNGGSQAQHVALDDPFADAAWYRARRRRTASCRRVEQHAEGIARMGGCCARRPSLNQVAVSVISTRSPPGGRQPNIHPAAVEDRRGPLAAYWVENDHNKINAIPQIARLAPFEERRPDSESSRPAGFSDVAAVSPDAARG
jgi:hypothetical protein